MTSKKEPIRYYWCVNCGHHGDFGKEYLINKNCENCDYDDVTGFTKQEILENEDLRCRTFKRKNTY